jgi:hypothetical protein
MIQIDHFIITDIQCFEVSYMELHLYKNESDFASLRMTMQYMEKQLTCIIPAKGRNL